MDKVLVIDFGSQVTKLITKKIRQLGVYSEIKSHNISYDAFLEGAYTCIIFSGGPESVNDPDSPNLSFDIQKIKQPILGICYGMQLMVKNLSGKITSSHSHEYGSASIKTMKESAILKGLYDDPSLKVWMSHGDTVTELPKGFSEIACTEKGEATAVMENKEKKWYGLQFHPEVEHTERGDEMIKNFVVDIAGCKQNWKGERIVNEAKQYVLDTVQSGKVICAVSGGVDSSTLAVLLNEALQDKEMFKAVLVNTGLLRLKEEEEVRKMFEKLDCALKVIDAREIFCTKLKGITDPEKKRKIIGNTFIEIFEKEARKDRGIKYLAQGTLYPDVIESVSTTGSSVTIKSHHNVGGLPEKMGLKLVEPFRNMFKDEVREIGRALGLPKSFIGRHPFPGPGLAVRVLGEVTPQKCEILKQADDIFIRLLREYKYYDKIWQAFAVLLPIKTVGVMGDGRTYDYICGLRAITSSDGMTADVFEFEPQFLKKTATQIVNQVVGINRVVFDYTSKPPATIEWE